jgi:hypothetical protein
MLIVLATCEGWIMSSSVKLSAIQGDTLGPIVFSFKNADGSIFDLTGSTLSIEIKGSAPMLYSSVAGVELSVPSPNTGVAQLRLTSAQTAQLLVGTNSTFRLRRIVGTESTTLLSGVFETEKGGL